MVSQSTSTSRKLHTSKCRTERCRPFARWYGLLKRWDRLDRESVRLRVVHRDTNHPAVIALIERRDATIRRWQRFDADCANDFIFFLRRAYDHNPDTLRAMLRRIIAGEPI